MLIKATQNLKYADDGVTISCLFSFSVFTII